MVKTEEKEFVKIKIIDKVNKNKVLTGKEIEELLNVALDEDDYIIIVKT